MGMTCMVIGGSSSIGKELLPLLAQNNDTIIVTECSDKINELQAFKEEICGRNAQVHIDVYEMDVKNVMNIQTVFQMIKEKGQLLDSFVYLPGINPIMPAFEVTEQTWDAVMDINLKGFFFTAQEAAMNMIFNQKASIVTIASQHGVAANTDRAPYCASKAGLIHLVKALSLEWIRYHIRVNVISPTFILSENTEKVLNHAKYIRNYLYNIPARKYVTPQDICNAVLFLISDKSSMIVGHNLMIDGGWTIQ